MVPRTEMFDLTVLLVLYFLGVFMVAFFDEPHAPSPQLAITNPATKRSDMMNFEPFFMFFIVYLFSLIFNVIYVVCDAFGHTFRHYKITKKSSDSQTFSDFL